MYVRSYILVAALIILIFSACEKVELPIELPPAGTAQMSSVNMGADYSDQVFFDFETGSVVKTSLVGSWDLAFESSADGYHIFMNGGKNIFLYNTHETIPGNVTTGYQYGIKDTSYAFDAPCGLPDSTGVGEWVDANKKSRKEIYVVKMSSTNYKKIIINSVSDTSYSLSYGDLSSTSMTNITIPKNRQCNYSYFSFDNGGIIISPEPANNTWDIVFTRYRYIYRELEDFPYLVSGVLLNPAATLAMADSNTGFANINYNLVAGKVFSNHRDVIGYDWKTAIIDVNTNTAVFVVNPLKSYVVKTRKNQYWKLHFLNFYDSNGVKGNPSFEYERIK